MIKQILLSIGLLFGIFVAPSLIWVGIYALNNVEFQAATDAELAPWRTREKAETGVGQIVTLCPAYARDIVIRFNRRSQRLISMSYRIPPEKKEEFIPWLSRTLEDQKYRLYSGLGLGTASGKNYYTGPDYNYFHQIDVTIESDHVEIQSFGLNER